MNTHSFAVRVHHQASSPLPTILMISASRHWPPAWTSTAVSAELDIWQLVTHPRADTCVLSLDFSHRGGRERLERHLTTEELDDVSTGRKRARIIKYVLQCFLSVVTATTEVPGSYTASVWRPLDVVTNAPLVISDRRSILQDDLIEVEKVLPDKVERNAYVKYKPYHQYYYLSNQGPEDVALFMTWDMERGKRTAGMCLFASLLLGRQIFADTARIRRHRGPAPWCCFLFYRRLQGKSEGKYRGPLNCSRGRKEGGE